jgi:phage gp36-like protein
MAHYATREDVVQLYGADLLVRVSDLDADDVADDNVVDAGLQAADDTVNAFLSALYPVPVSPVPGSVRRCAIDIAVYTMALGVTSRTDEMRVRYEDALALLKMMAKGDIGLGLPPTDEDGDGVNETNPNIRRKGRIFEIGRG